MLGERGGVVRGRTCDMHHRRDRSLSRAPWNEDQQTTVALETRIRTDKTMRRRGGREGRWWSEVGEGAKGLLHKSRDRLGLRQDHLWFQTRLIPVSFVRVPHGRIQPVLYTGGCCAQDLLRPLVTWSTSRRQLSKSGLGHLPILFELNDLYLLLRWKWPVCCPRTLLSG